MNLTKTLVALGLIALPASALARTMAPRALDQDDDAKALVQKLGDKEYKVRRDAYRQLEKLGASARPALESAAKSDDPEVRWNASRLLDRLDEQNGGLKERGEASRDDNDEQDAAPRTGPAHRALPRDLEQQMRELERRMQEFQKEFERDGFFHGGGPFGIQGADPFHRFGQGFGQILGEGGELDLQPGSSFSRSSTVDGRTESFTLRVDENGHVTAEEQKDGKTTKVESDSIEAFRKEHPEMLHRGPLTIAIHPFGQGGQTMKVPGEGMKVTVPVPMPPPQPDAATTAPKKRNKVKAPRPETVEPAPAAKDDSAKSDSAKDRAAKEPKPRLGVELAPVPAEVADYLELDGDAFQVVRVMDDMPAARKGLKPRDILLEVNGTPIHAFDDVVKALDGVDPDTVKVVVLRKGQRKEL